MQRYFLIVSLLILILTFQSTLLAESNEPNPFSPVVTYDFIEIEYDYVCSPVIEIYNIDGKVIGKIFYENLPAGRQEIDFDMRDWDNGAYFFKSLGCKDTITKKWALMHDIEPKLDKKKEDFFYLCPKDGISYYLTEDSDVLLLLKDYNTNQVLDTLISETQSPGQYAYFWDNTGWPSGRYRISMKVNEKDKRGIEVVSDSSERNEISCYLNALAVSNSIGYDLKNLCHVCLVVYNIQGEIVDTMTNEVKEPGYHIESWKGEGRPSGVYFCRGTICDSSFVRKFLLLK